MRPTSFWLRGFRGAVAGMLGLGFAVAAEAQTTFTGLGASFSSGGMSADGTVVVGTGGSSALRWSAGSGASALGTLGGFWAKANGVSADGTVVVGQSGTPSFSVSVAYRWTQGTGMTSLGTLGGDGSWANGASADGAVIVGTAEDAGWNQFAFRWTESGGLESLGTIAGGTFSNASAVSADGTVVVGEGDDVSGNRQAMRWTQAGGMVGLGTLGGSYANATAVSADGAVVVGNSGTGMGTGAFRWTEATGIVALDTPAGALETFAAGVSADGRLVGGMSMSFADQFATIWDETGAAYDLRTYLTGQSADLANSLDGWTLLDVFAVSGANGTYHLAGAGLHDGSTEAFLVSGLSFGGSAIPEPSTYAAWAGALALAGGMWRRVRGGRRRSEAGAVCAGAEGAD